MPSVSGKFLGVWLTGAAAITILSTSAPVRDWGETSRIEKLVEDMSANLAKIEELKAQGLQGLLRAPVDYLYLHESQLNQLFTQFDQGQLTLQSSTQTTEDINKTEGSIQAPILSAGGSASSLTKRTDQFVAAGLTLGARATKVINYLYGLGQLTQYEALVLQDDRIQELDRLLVFAAREDIVVDPDSAKGARTAITLSAVSAHREELVNDSRYVIVRGTFAVTPNPEGYQLSREYFSAEGVGAIIFNAQLPHSELPTAMGHIETFTGQIFGRTLGAANVDGSTAVQVVPYAVW